MRRARGLALAGLVAVWSTAAASLALAAAPAEASKAVGDWKGVLKVAPGVELNLVFHIVESSGTFSATMDSPDQGANGIKVESVSVKDAAVSLGLKALNAKFEGKLDEKGENLKGDFTQNGATFPLALARFDGSKEKTPEVPKELAGIWEGKLQAAAGIELRIVLKVVKNKEGKLTAALRSPDQTDQDLPVNSVTLEGKKVTVTSKLLRVTYEGELDSAKNEIVGKWKQGTATLPLTIKRTEKETQVKRPQTPKGPFPYESVNVVYDNPAAKGKLAGTLTKPKGDGPFPVAIMITGSGAQDRDETLFQHKPFFVIADALTRRGIAVLRVDDRGVGGSTGSTPNDTSADFAEDVHAGINFLKTRKDIDAEKIGLIGHSEGGLIAPMVAAKYPNDVAFIVLLAGPGLDGATIVKLQSALILKVMGAKPEELKQQTVLLTKLFEITKAEPDDAKAKKQLVEATRKFVATLSKEKQEEFKASGDLGESRVAAFASPWFRYFTAYDPRPTLSKVKCPVLAVNGEKDLQVPPKEDLEEIAKALKAGGNTRFVTKELPGLNHLFQTSKSGSPSEYASIEETIAPSALNTITDWVVATVGKK